MQGKRQKKGRNIEEENSKIDEVLENEESLETSKPRRGGRRRKNEERITESEGAACKETGRSTRSQKNQTKQAAELKKSVPDLENIAEKDQNETEVDETGVAFNAEVKVDPRKQTWQSEAKRAKGQANDSPDEADPMDEERFHIVSTAPVDNANHEEARHAMVGHGVQDKGQSPGTVDPYGEVLSIEVKKGELKDHGSDQGNGENAQGFDNGSVHDMEEQSPVSHKGDPVSVFDEQKEKTIDRDVQNGERPMNESEYQTQEASPSLNYLEEEVANEMPPKISPGKKSHSNDSKTGFAANLISSVKTLLSSSEHTSSQEAEKSEYVDKEAILREEKERLEKEEAKKQAELEEKARLERIQAEKAREQEQLRRQKEEEIAAKRRARQEEERRKREEKAKRLEEHKRRRKLEAEAAARSGSGVAGLQGGAATSGGSLAAAKERLAKIQQQAAMLKNNSSKTPNDYPNLSTQNRSTYSGTPQRVVKSTGEHPTTTPKNTQAASPSRAGDNLESHYRSYEISPYRSDHASDDDVPKKPVPEWARGKTLMAQLVAQMYVDPDEVFQQHAKTCSLDQVFANSRKNGRRDFNKRNSSGNWIEDRVTWKEELGYKKAMGYI